MSDRLAVAFRTLGCKVNRVESEDIAAELLGRGVRIVDEDEAAVIVVNTCTVTGEADAKARKAVRRALAAAGRPLVVVTGCAASSNPEPLAALGDRVVVEPDKDSVALRVSESLAVVDGVPAAAERIGSAFRTRAMIKVQDGCDAFCAYCIVPQARGLPRSVAADVVVERAATLVAAGVHEVVLTGINLGRYQSDGCDLAGLVEKVAATGVDRVRLSSIEPLDLGERLLAVLAATPSVCAHLHVPLQSGADDVLASMGRGYAAAEYESVIAAARRALPGCTISTDVMVGFPGESDEAARQTREVCERIGFSWIHVFRYSARAGTPAASMEQVPADVKAERSRLLRAVGTALHERFLSEQFGRDAEALVERIDGPIAEGITREHVRARFAAPKDVAIGDLFPVRLGAPEGDVVMAVPC